MGKGLGIAGLVSVLAGTSCATLSKRIEEPPYRTIHIVHEETDTTSGTIYSVVYNTDTRDCAVWETQPFLQRPYLPRGTDTRPVDPFYKSRLVEEYCKPPTN